MAELRQVLTHYDLRVLQALARELNVKLDARSPKDAARVLERFIGATETVRRAWDRLRAPEREALARLQRIGGYASARGFKLSLLRSGVVTQTPQPGGGIWGHLASGEDYEAKADYGGSKPCFEDVIARLTVLGLVLSEREANRKSVPIHFSPGPLIFIPDVVRKQLPPPPSVMLTPIEPEQIASGSARQFQRDLGRYWRVVRRMRELRLTTQGYTYKADAKALNAALGRQDNRGEQDHPRLYFLRAHLTDLKLLMPGLQGLAPAVQADFWTRPAAERVKASFEAWRDGRGWNELLRIPIKRTGYDHRNPAPPELVAARQAILKHIAAMGKGWISFDALLERIALADYDFLFPRNRVVASPYYYAPPGARTPYYAANNLYSITFEGITDEAEGWQKVEGGFVSAMLAGPLFWMGLVDLGGKDMPAEERFPVAYRFTDLGAWVLGIGAPVEIPEEGGRVVIQPNFQVMAMEPMSDRVLGELDEFTESEGGDRALLYRLTRQSVYRGQQLGWDVPRMIARLEELSGATLPANVRRSLEEWDTLYNRIVIHRDATLLLAADAAVLDQVLSDPRCAQVLGRRLAPEATLPSGSADDVAQTLREVGWSPLATPRGKDDFASSVKLDEEGRVGYLQPTPSLGARIRLSSLTEDSRITPQTVKATIKAGRNVDTILADLRAVSAGPVPPELVVKIKAWGNYYGDGTLGQATLLEVRDRRVLLELCADPELAPYLKPFEAGERALALVDPEHADEVRGLLARRGIGLRGKFYTA